MVITDFQFREVHSFNFKPISLFADKANLVYSVNNSTGKTTLLRAILYSLGFNIPDTELIKFGNYEFSVKVIFKGTQYDIIRKNNLMTINGIEYDLPVDEAAVHTILFGISNQELLSNLLGVIYFDQEKGWTLLNRGTIIGINRFNIEGFFRGLKDDDSQESYALDSARKALDKKIAQYKLMINVAQFQEELNTSVSKKFDYIGFDEELRQEYFEKKQRLSTVEMELANIDNMIKRNKNFVDYIERKKIYVKDESGSVVRVTRHNLLNYNEMLDSNDARRSLLTAERNGIRRRLAEIEAIEDQQITFENIPTVEEQLLQRMAELKGISEVDVQSVLLKLQRERARVATQLRERTKRNNVWIDEAYEIIKKYATELEIPFDYKIDIFTSNLKAKSGAILHKLVFIYKLAYIQLLSKKIGEPLPIICDSPSGREVEKETIKTMLQIIKRDFSKHQLIIASIYKYEDVFEESNVIPMDGTLFNQQTLFD